MEPISAVGLTASLLGCVKIITSGINSLLALQTKFRQADLTVQLFLGQLLTLRAALNQVCEWITVSLVGDLRHEQLVSDLTISIEGCKVLLSILGDHIASLDRNRLDQDGVEPLSIQGKMRLLWAENESNQYFSHLSNQISALNLLLTALQCRSVHEQNTLLQNDESRNIMHLVRDDTSSLLLLKDGDSYISRQSTLSILSDNSSKLEMRFEFDRQVFNSKAYQEAIRSALSRKTGKLPQRQGPPMSDAKEIADYHRPDDSEEDVQSIRSKSVDPWPSNNAISTGIIKKSSHANDAILVTRGGKGKMPEFQGPPSNDAIGRFDETEDDAQNFRSKTVNSRPLQRFNNHESFIDIEDDAETVRDMSMDSWPLNDAISDEIIKKSNQADDAIPVTREKNGKIPQRQELLLNDVIDVVGYQRFNDTGDDAQIVQKNTVDSWVLSDVVDVDACKLFIEIEDDAQAIGSGSGGVWPLNDAVPDGVIKNSILVASEIDIEDSSSPRVILPASNIGEETADEENPPTGDRQPVSKDPIYTNIASALNEKAVVELGVPKKVCSKVLITGSSGAGKSTLLKSMTICDKGTLCSHNDRERYKDIIHSNLVEDILKIFDATKTFDIGFDSEYNPERFLTIMREPDEVFDEIALALRAFWNDSDAQPCFRTLDSHRLNDPSGYYFNHIDRIASPNYIPTNQDILRLHMKTTGIVNEVFTSSKFTYNVYDVGDARSKRFPNADFIIFLVDISAYDRGLYGDDSSNMMQDALTHFDSICNNQCLLETSIILFFTKVDSLERKLAISPFDRYFVDFKGDASNVEAVKAYIMARFVSLEKRLQNNLHVYFAEMTDDESSGRLAFAALETCAKLREGWI